MGYASDSSDDIKDAGVSDEHAKLFSSFAKNASKKIKAMKDKKHHKKHKSQDKR